MIDATHAVQFFQALERTLLMLGYYPTITEAGFNGNDNKSQIEFVVTISTNIDLTADNVHVTLGAFHSKTNPLQAQVKEILIDPSSDTSGFLALESTDQLSKELKAHSPSMELDAQFLGRKLCEYFASFGLVPQR